MVCFNGSSNDYAAGHAQQNVESLNNILKLLDVYYKKSNFFIVTPVRGVIKKSGGILFVFCFDSIGE